MAAGNLALVSNRAFGPYLAPYVNDLLFEQENVEHLANQIIALYERNNREQIAVTLKETAKRDFSIEKLIPKIVGVLGQHAM
jgi:hypothetical protein